MSNLMRVALLFSLVLFSSELSAGVVINEFSSSNRTTITDEDGDYSDWIELFNAGAETVELEGYGLSDNPAVPFKWVFPALTIAPGEHLLVWASGKDRRPQPGDLHHGIMREFYPNIPGDAVAQLLGHSSFPDHPATRNLVTDHFDAPVNISDNYGQRMHGFIVPPLTGNYTFWIASDDNSALYLSPGTSMTVDYNSPIARVPAWTNWREWNKYPEQRSAPIHLVAGEYYYISALMKEAQGGDNLTVRWQLPNSVIEEPIPAQRVFWGEGGGGFHANFSISSDGEPLQLTAPDGTVVDVTVPVRLSRDISYGRAVDGGNEWVFFANPTPGASNNGSTGYIGLLDPPAFSETTGFFAQNFSLELSSNQPAAEIFYTLDGSPPSRDGPESYTYRNQHPNGSNLTRTVQSLAYQGPMEISKRAVPVAGIDTIRTHGDQPVAWVRGWNQGWSMDGNELVQSSMGENIRLTFGDADWGDYELTLQARKTGGDEGVVLYVRTNIYEYYKVNLGGSNNSQYVIQKGDGRGGQAMAGGQQQSGSIQAHQWHDIRVRAEGNRIRVWLNNNQIFDFTDHSSPYLTGKVGVGTFKTQARFRNFQVTSLNGQTVLASGIPTMESNVAVVRARAFKEGYIPSETVTHTYFVGPDAVERMKIPVISIATHEAGFFSLSNGIYIPGNDMRTGIEWERPAHVTFFEPDGRIGFAQEAGIRLHGGTTKDRPQKSLRLYARDTLYGESHFEHAVFPDLPFDSYKRLILRHSGNDRKDTMFRDALIQRLLGHLRFDTQAYRPAAVYLNGRYWGLHNIRERYDKHYLARTYGVGEEELDVVEFKPWSSPLLKEGSTAHYDETISYIEANGLSNPQHYDFIKTRIDVENFLDYAVGQIIVNNTDWPGNNHDFWRKQVDEYDPHAPYGHDGRWRWLMFDMDFGFDGFWAHWFNRPSSFNFLAAITQNQVPNDWHEWYRQPQPTFLLRRLLDNESFRHDFINRFADLLNTSFLPGRVIGTIDQMQATIAHEMEFHRERWGEPADWHGRVQAMRDFASNRPGHMRSHLRSKFNLSQAQLHLNVASHDAGHIRVNATDLDESTPGVGASPYPWSGIYFNEVPIKLEAIARPGYRFSHWMELQGTPDATSRIISVSLAGGRTRTAVFEEQAEPQPVHYWHFNDLSGGTVSTIEADYSLAGNAWISYPGEGVGYLDDTTGSDLNVRFGQEAGRGLRVRNPSDTRALHFVLPTTGFEEIRFSYAVMRTSNGARGHSIEYSTSPTGDVWQRLEHDPVNIGEQYQVLSFDFSEIPAANHNPHFVLRILFTGPDASGDSGNNRFDNILLEAVPLEGTVLPPQLSEPIVSQQVVEDVAHAINLDAHFSSDGSAAITYNAWADKAGLVDLSVIGSDMFLTPLHRGEVTITVSADDGVNPPVETTFRLLIYPQPHLLANGIFHFGEWESDHPENSFPEHMLFLQSDLSDPGLDIPLEHAYFIAEEDYHLDDSVGFPYNNTRRTRLNGLGEEGISFVNTGQNRDLGGALVALNTTGLDAAYVSWTGGTVTPNSRAYGLRLQYRVSPDQPFADLLDEAGMPVEYTRNPLAGHFERVGPVSLPSVALGHENVQLLWRYYYTGERLDLVSGTRDELRLDDILVTASDQAQQATRLAFAAFPEAAQAEHPSSPVTVTAVTDAGVLDGEISGEVSLVMQRTEGGFTETFTAAMADGIAIFGGLLFPGHGTFTLRAEGAGLQASTSGPIQVIAMTEVIVPRYIQGNQDANDDNNDRVPFAFLVTIEGLTPGATYRYGNRVVVLEDSFDQNGAGNMIFVTGRDAAWIRNTDSPRFGEEDHALRHHSFSADPNGTYTGWFITEPTGNVRFTPGNVVTLRLFLNDGAGGEDEFHYLNTNRPIDVISFGASSNQGSAVMGRATHGNRNFAVLYADEDGLGRPLAATPIEMTGSETDTRFAAFYHETVAVEDRRWGTILPNALPLGLRRIEERSLENGALLHVLLESDGFAGTVHASNGLSPIDLGGETLAVPTISSIPDQTILVNTSTDPLSFSVGHDELSPGLLSVSASSSNTILAPNSGIVFGGSDAGRTVTVTPAPGQTGTALITVTVSDGELTASASFGLAVLTDAAPVVFNFQNGDPGGWTEGFTDSQGRQQFAVVPPGMNSPNMTPHSDSHFIGLHIPAFTIDEPMYTQDSPHDTLIMRSPEFTLNGSGDLNAWLCGGGAGSPSLAGTSVSALSAVSTDGGFRGIALRDVNTGTYVLSGTKSSNGNEWEQTGFSAAQLAALPQDHVYTLELIDAAHGGWGWVNMDSVTIPGTLVDEPVEPEMPMLMIQSSGENQVRLSWPSAAAGLTLQRSSEAGGEYVNAGLPVVVDGEENVVYDTIVPGRQFYRLRN